MLPQHHHALHVQASPSSLWEELACEKLWVSIACLWLLLTAIGGNGHSVVIIDTDSRCQLPRPLNTELNTASYSINIKNTLIISSCMMKAIVGKNNNNIIIKTYCETTAIKVSI